MAHRAPRRRGFTVIELLAGVSLIGILLAVGSVSLDAASTAFRLDHGVRTVGLALERARLTALARSHVLQVAFTAHQFQVTDRDVGANGTVIMTGTIPSPLSLTASGAATFSTLGTVANPVSVTVQRGQESRIVRVGLSGEVDIQ